MKRAGYLTERIADTDNLLLAYYKASLGKQMKGETLRFASRLDEHVAALRAGILSGRVDVGHYRYFRIYDPKSRLICAASFPERVLHHAIMNVCHPYFERQLIETTCATRPGKGIYQAMDYARPALRRYPFVAKFDFRKYYDSIDHGILKERLRRLFKDTRLLNIFDRIIDSYVITDGNLAESGGAAGDSRTRGAEAVSGAEAAAWTGTQSGATEETGAPAEAATGARGIPIGNLTSQYFANYYLSGMDHYIKEVLGVKAYIRYMDDFLIFAASAEELGEQAARVRDYAAEKLALTLKPVITGRSERGVSFLGYVLYPHKVLLNRRSKQRLGQKLSQYDRLRETAVWSEKEYMEHITPLLAFAGHGYTKSLRRSMMGNGNG